MSNALPEERMDGALGNLRQLQHEADGRRLSKWGRMVVEDAASALEMAVEQAEKIGRLEEALRPFVVAFDAAEEAYRKRGGNPETINQDAPWFEIGATLLVGGKPTVPSHLRILASPHPYRAARQALSNNRPSQGEGEGETPTADRSASPGEPGLGSQAARVDGSTGRPR